MKFFDRFFSGSGKPFPVCSGTVLAVCSEYGIVRYHICFYISFSCIIDFRNIVRRKNVIIYCIVSSLSVN